MWLPLKKYNDQFKNFENIILNRKNGVREEKRSSGSSRKGNKLLLKMNNLDR